MATKTNAYTYRIGWSKLGISYYGVRYSKKITNGELWNKYFTSSRIVKKFRKIHGEPDIIEVRKIFSEKEKAMDWELRVLKRLKIHNNPKWLNSGYGGYLRDEKNFQLIAKERGKICSILYKGKHFSPDTEFNTNSARKIAVERSKTNSLPAQISATNGTHHWQTEEHRKRISKSNRRFKNSVSVVDKQGNSFRINKEEFDSQKIGSRESWKYVGVASLEGKKRKEMNGY